MVTDEERDYMYAEYARDPRMKVNLGIRRRLAPLLDNNRDLIELFHALLFSLPGTPILYYGDEIGMGDNVYLGDRDSVRTPMQWSPDRNAGFSRAEFPQLYLPPLMDSVYGYPAVNVESQQRDPSSLLLWVKRMLSVRQDHPVFGTGSFEVLPAENPAVLAFMRELDGSIVLCVNNLSHRAQPVELYLAAYEGKTPVELLGRVPFPPIGKLPYFVTLEGYGFFWFELIDEARG
jgi:maltose alpha-D-glucosyltransferase / alpha-amylase